jgi:hypothetical protein
LFLPILILVSVLPALASAPPSCAKAASSGNGSFLVIRDFQLESTADRSRRIKIQQVSFQVLTKTEFLNDSERFTSGATYWEPLWDVVLTGNDQHPMPYCAVPLVSDDGEFLVLLSEHAAGPDDSALWIYRRRYHPGDRLGDGPETSTLVKTVTLGEIWPVYKFPKVLMVTDSTPLWFSGGSFDFSENNRLLMHDTRSGNSVRISLSDGAVSKK